VVEVRKKVLLLASVALVMLFASGVALAITKTCSSSPCYGTKHNDTLMERAGVDDNIYGRAGDDTINVGRGAEREIPSDTDILHGDRGDDRLKSDDLEGRDELHGGRGYDVCIIDTGDSTQGCQKVKRVSVRVD
jgi:Ca2+-binding RTX toxin-like protein